MEPASSCEKSPPVLVVLFFLSLGKTYTAVIHLIAGKTALSSFISNTPSRSISLRQRFYSSTSTSCFPVFVRESPAAMVTLILTDRKLKPIKAGQLSQISPMVSPSRNKSNPGEEEVRRRWKILRPAEIADRVAWNPGSAAR